MAQGGGGFLNKVTEAFKKRFLGPSLDGQIISGRYAVDMPQVPVAALQKTVIACNTGPGGGLTDLSQQPDSDESMNRASVVAGILDWYRPHPRADGLSVSLYEKKLNSSDHHGDPIADAFVLAARPNSCIMALADGVNWGFKPRMAARAALLGAMEHLHQKLFETSTPPGNTQDIFHHILLAFDNAHKSILSHGGTTTTLTVAMACELRPNHLVSSRWGLCVVSVGDSPCFLYRPDYGVVHEVTAAGHMGKGRDPRDAGGCLGANLGDLPDLTNLICIFLPVFKDDIVFVTSDGISDNFDPVILKRGVSESPSPFSSLPTSITSPPPAPLPYCTPKERQDYLTNRMAEIIKERQERIEHMVTVQDVVDALISYTVDATDKKREFLEWVWRETSDPALSPGTRRDKERRLSQQCKTLPGKLDHTTVVGYQVGELPSISPQATRRPSSQSESYSNTSATVGGNQSTENVGRFAHLRRIASVNSSMYRPPRY